MPEITSRYPVLWKSKSKKGEVRIEDMDSPWLLNAYRKIGRLEREGVEIIENIEARPFLLAEIRTREWGDNPPPEATQHGAE